MAANTGQGRSFATFLVGLTVGCYGIASFSSGLGKLAFVAGAAILIGSLFGFLKLKSLEGKPAQKAVSGSMKLVGAFLAALGWIVTLVGVHLVDSTGGRITFALVGIALSLVGIIGVLPAAFNKNAIWKT
ncbi:MAG TPA: hypothetical protein VH079_09730 [Terriglobales bacterium]|jgi:hypothetical protein|nr:hypothetical protein [Terriglobales bacterium]